MFSILIFNQRLGGGNFERGKLDETGIGFPNFRVRTSIIVDLF